MVFQPYDPAATIRWYDEHSDRYDQETFSQDDDRYGGDVYRIALVRRLLAEHRPGRVLDVGCGTAEPMLRLLDDGFDVRGFDFSPGMVNEAKRKLKAKGYSEGLAEVGDLLDPAIVKQYGESAHDAVIANGVLPYIPARDEPHRHLAALLKPGGLYISAYSNALFDLVTFNRFTIRFHMEKFIQGLTLGDEDRAELHQRLASLVTHPDEPATIAQGAREHVFVRSDVPFEVSADLAKLGLKQIDLLFYKFHAFPPLLKNSSPGLRKSFVQESRAYEIERARDWRGYFLASTFIMVCRKEG